MERRNREMQGQGLHIYADSNYPVRASFESEVGGRRSQYPRSRSIFHLPCDMSHLPVYLTVGRKVMKPL